MLSFITTTTILTDCHEYALGWLNESDTEQQNKQITITRLKLWFKEPIHSWLVRKWMQCIRSPHSSTVICVSRLQRFCLQRHFAFMVTLQLVCTLSRCSSMLKSSSICIVQNWTWIATVNWIHPTTTTMKNVAASQIKTKYVFSSIFSLHFPRSEWNERKARERKGKTCRSKTHEEAEQKLYLKRFIRKVSHRRWIIIIIMKWKRTNERSNARSSEKRIEVFAWLSMMNDGT